MPSSAHTPCLPQTRHDQGLHPAAAPFWGIRFPPLLDLIEREVARPTVQQVLDRAAKRAGRASASAVDVLEEARGEREGRWQQPRS